MKKIFLITLLTLNLTYSQECKFTKNEIDDFSKKKVLVLKESVLAFDFSENSVTAELNFNSTIFINFLVRFSSHKSFVVSENNKLMILLKNDEVLETNLEPSAGKFIGNGGLMSYTDFNIKFILTEEILQKIGSTGIKKIRLETSEGNKDFDVKDKRNDQFTKTINCFLSEMKK